MNLFQALVLKSTGKSYQIKSQEHGLLEAKLPGKFRLKNIKHTNPVAVGDQINYSINKNGTAIIQEIHERENYIIRKSVNLSKKTQIIASNIDQLYLMASLSNPLTSLGFIDRILVNAEAYKIPCTILLNKTDLHGKEENLKQAEYQSIYETIGYPFFEISVIKNKNIDELTNQMKGKINLIVGHSGVGKSSLLNTLDPNLYIKTDEVSKFNEKGKHTTTFAQMHTLPFGGFLIDSPGIKEFGLIDFEQNEIQNYFPEIFVTKNKCKFHNCTHQNEPKCAVKQAIIDDKISESRYYNYLGFIGEIQDNSNQKN